MCNINFKCTLDFLKDHPGLKMVENPNRQLKLSDITVSLLYLRKRNQVSDR